MTITAVSLNEESTWLVPAWLVLLLRVLSTELAVTRGPVVDPGLAARYARHFPSWQVALVRRAPQVSMRRPGRRRTNDRECGKRAIGRDPIADHHRRSCTPILRGIRIT